MPQAQPQPTQDAGNLPRVVWCEPIPDRRFTDQFGNPQRWLLRVKDGGDRGKVVFPLGFTVDPQVKEYPVEVVVEGQRYLVGRLHVRHVHGEQYDCCVFKCALCGELFKDCRHPLAKQCLEEVRMVRERMERFREGMEYIAMRVRESMPDVVKELNEAVELLDRGFWTRELAERLYKVFSILPVRCYEGFYSEYICTDGSYFRFDSGVSEPGFVFRLSGKLTPYTLHTARWLIWDKLNIDVKYYVSIWEQW